LDNTFLGKFITADDEVAENVKVFLKNETNAESQHWKISPLYKQEK